MHCIAFAKVQQHDVIVNKHIVNGFVAQCNSKRVFGAFLNDVESWGFDCLKNRVVVACKVKLGKISLGFLNDIHQLGVNAFVVEELHKLVRLVFLLGGFLCTHFRQHLLQIAYLHNIELNFLEIQALFMGSSNDFHVVCNELVANGESCAVQLNQWLRIGLDIPIKGKDFKIFVILQRGISSHDRAMISEHL